MQQTDIPRPAPFPGAWVFALLNTLGVIALAFLALYLVVGRYNEPSATLAYNSDDVAFLALADDLLQGSDLSAWHLPVAPYLFPDVVLLLLCRLLFVEVAWVFFAYTCLFYSLFAAALAWLGREMGLEGRRALTAGALGVALMMAVNLDPRCDWRGRLLPLPSNHVAALLVGVVLTAYVLRSLRRGYRPLEVTMALIAGGLAVMSDRLMVPQFLLPLGVVVLVLRFRGAVQTGQVIRTWLFLAGLGVLCRVYQFAMICYGFKLHELRLITTGSKNDLTTIYQHARITAHWLRQQPLECTAVAIGTLLALVLAIRAWRNGRAIGPLGGALTIFLSACAVCVPLALIGDPFVMPLERYFFSLTILPVLALPLWLAVGAKPLPRLAFLARLGVVAVVVWQCGTAIVERGIPWVEAPYPPLAQALDRLAREKKLRAGICAYWQARQMRYLTHEQVLVLPTFQNGRPFLHGNNPELYFSADPEALNPQTFNFVIINAPGNWPGPSPANIRAEFGEPLERHRVSESEPTEIWIYDHLESVQFTGFLRTLQARRLERALAPVALPTPAVLGARKDGFANDYTHGRMLSVPAKGSVEVTFAAPVHARLLDISADDKESFSIELARGEESLAILPVPSVPWTGEIEHYNWSRLRSRLVEVPTEVVRRGWDRAVVRSSVPRPIQLAHILPLDPGADVHVPPIPYQPRRFFEAEDLFTLADPQTSRCADPNASAGFARHIPAGTPQLLVFGPYIYVPAGTYEIRFAVRSNASADLGEIAVLDAYCPKGVLAQRLVTAAECPASDRYRNLRLTVHLEQDTQLTEFRFWTRDKCQLWVDSIELVAVDDVEDATVGR
jgi:hypothetical protein